MSIPSTPSSVWRSIDPCPNVEGEVVVVTLHQKTGQFARGWRPVLAVLKSWDELGLPPRGV